MSISKGATVLVTGATGAVGPRVVQALCKAGQLSVRFHWIGRKADDSLPCEALAKQGRQPPLRDSPGRSALAELRAATAGQATDQASPKGYAPARDGPAMLKPVSAM